MDKEFKIPTGYIETGEVNSIETTPFQNGDVLEFHKGREDLRPMSEIHDEAVNFATATEIPETREIDVFTLEANTFLQEVDYAGRKAERMRKDRAAGIDPSAVAVSALQRNGTFDKDQFGLAA
ncbi:hypothetical protein PV379_04990 [Streptomyces caniscabiei]|uniref:hypothetical protein n=1 Tax=Streptomyces caniscabiei TaxID=2746961 RepID=UPI0029B8E348|nr:hypothetical protein [Streptomyces caniscabiei]MDX2776686.1 hypothetical protein [Streptomyces caniscabiei]